MDAFSLANGLHFDVPFPQYLNWPVMSQSTLKEGRRSMAHLKAALDGERKKVPTDAMILGSALHTSFLEPEQAQERIVLWDGGRRFGKEWDAFVAHHKNKIILTENQYESLIGMVESLRRHPEVKKWSKKLKGVEVSCLGDVHGLRFKGRCDGLTNDPLVDLKKVADGEHHKIVRQVEDFGYHLQAWIYCQLFQRDRFMLITVEDDPPYDVCAYEMSPGYMRRGAEIAKSLIESVLECQRTDTWPGRSQAPILLEAPEWGEE